MGYLSSLRGFIEISPPLSWSAFKDTDFYGDKAEAADRAIVIEVDTQHVDTDEGRFEIITGIGIFPISDEQGKWYNFEADFSLLLSQVHFDGHILTGQIMRVGDGQGDVERYWVQDGRLRSEKAELRWPDGSLVAFG